MQQHIVTNQGEEIFWSQRVGLGFFSKFILLSGYFDTSQSFINIFICITI